ncbi:unnamed protein product, partial [Rotaria sp. Silwood2]
PSSSSSSSSLTIRRPSPVSFDFTRLNLCKNCHRSSINFSCHAPLTSFTRIPQRYFLRSIQTTIKTNST